MTSNAAFWKDKRVCVTGGTGFLGAHLVEQLLRFAAHVRVLGLAPKSPGLRARLRDVECVHADVRDPIAVANAVRNCDVVFHTAGAVAFWGPALRQMHSIHADGVSRVLEALPPNARLVHTSSVVAVGASRDGAILDEESPFELEHLKVDYVHAKRTAEQLALTAASQGKDVVVVNPGYLVGPGDDEGSVIGRFCLRFWKGRVPLIPPGGFDLVDVRDVALGHLLAAEHGQRGRRYILGGENGSMWEFARCLAEVRGQVSRRLPMPGWFFTLLARGAEIRAHLRHRDPYPSMQQARVSRYHWYYSSARARTELGYDPRPLRESLADAHEWFCERGVLSRPPSRLAMSRCRAA
jgi:dihydroflavonol-4-reductase